MASSDPFQWARQYASDMNAAGARDSQQAQSALLTVFQEEAARQRPYSNLPVDLAKLNAQYDLSDRNNQRSSYRRGQAALSEEQQKRYNPAPEKIRSIIVAAANKWGVDPNIMLTIAELESGFKPQAKNPNSSATGLFQFINSTAQDYGIDPRDPYASADAAAKMAKQNLIAIGNKIGKENVQPWHAYLAHQQGLGGATKLLTNPQARATTLVGSKNAIGLNGGNDRMSGGAFSSIWARKFNNSYEQRLAARGRDGSGNDEENPVAALLNGDTSTVSPDGEIPIESAEPDANLPSDQSLLDDTVTNSTPREVTDPTQEGLGNDGALPPIDGGYDEADRLPVVEPTEQKPATVQGMTRKDRRYRPQANPIAQSAAPVIQTPIPKAPKVKDYLVNGKKYSIEESF